MKPRGLLLVALGGCAAVLVLALLFTQAPAGPRVCPAIGYGYVGDVELVFPQEPTTVAACFGEGCTPEPVTRSRDGRWLVPQTRPYLVPPVNVSAVFVEAAASTTASIARVLPIETEPTGEYPFGPECGGPFRFKPVHVPL